MPDAAKPSNSTKHSLAAQFQHRYECRLSDDLKDWFDRSIFERDGGNEYREAIDPHTLLESAPDEIWPSFMPSDFLPLIGSGEGDWLGVRVDADNNASEIIQWYHGGGDWIPWGRTLAEAIIFDAVGDRLPGPHRRHAIPAEPIQRRSIKENEWVAWALGFLPPDVAAIFSVDRSPQQVANGLIQNQVAEIAVRCELVQHSLDEPLSAVLTSKKAMELQIEWDDAVEWMFDVDRIPSDARGQLQSELDVNLDMTQDWKTAAEHCRRVTEISQEHAWAWDILGYSLEKLGESDQAVEAYARGAIESVFTSHSVRMKTHWTAKQSAKFSADRLNEITASKVKDDPYLSLLCEGSAHTRRESVQQFHLKSIETQGTDDPYRKLIAAGWDLGAEPMPAYRKLLQRIVQQADAAGQTARARVAQTHLACFVNRYGN